MAGLRGLLDTARSSLLTQQWAMQITGHNLSNVNTDGYSRQRGLLQARPGSSNRQLGVGAGVEGIQSVRLRQTWMDQELRRQASTFGETSMRNTLLQGMESRIGAPGENSIGHALDSFWADWSALSAAPEDSAARHTLIDSSDRLVQRFHEMHRGLVSQREDQNVNLDGLVDEVNMLSQSLATVNRRIHAAELAGGEAADLRDERDRQLDELSGLVDLQWEENEEGKLRVWLGGRALVDDVQANPIEAVSQTQDDGSRLLVPRWADGSSLDNIGGSLGGLLHVRDVVIPQKLEELDQMAMAMAEAVNSLHRQGVNLLGQSGRDFFDPNSMGAATLEVDHALMNDPDALAVSADGGAGNGDIATQIALLSTTKLSSLDDNSISDSWAGFVSDIGYQTRRAEEALQSEESFLLDLEGRRQSVSGVSLDEEMTLLMQQEQSYNAAARVLSVAEDMMDEVLRLV
jgi:flagellar hook-associated protein 1